MLDVSKKFNTLRTAWAGAELKAAPESLQKIREGQIPKGDPLTVARVAAVQAAKDTSRIIPFCHPMPVDHVEVNFELGEDRIGVEVMVKAIHKTGVEMEALTAASVAVLNLYDMLKGIDASLEILGVKLIKKKGGKSDFRDQYKWTLRSAVLVISDSVAAGKKDDHSGKMIEARLKEEGFEVAQYRIINDDLEGIVEAVEELADHLALDLVVTTGSTGFSPRDNAPEAMNRIFEREVPGISEAMRAYGQQRTPFAMISRGRAGIRGRTLIVNLPGSRRGVAESLDVMFPGVFHSFKMLKGAGHRADGLAADDRK
jgi:molybdenum cofactor biosynthesis protein MoaC